MECAYHLLRCQRCRSRCYFRIYSLYADPPKTGGPGAFRMRVLLFTLLAEGCARVDFIAGEAFSVQIELAAKYLLDAWRQGTI